MKGDSAHHADNISLTHLAQVKNVCAEIRSGNVHVFEQIYLQYYDKLWRIAFAFLHTKDDAEDTVQAVFIRVWNNRADLPVIESLDAYLSTAVRRECLRIIKHQKIVQKFEEAIGEDPAFDSSSTRSPLPDSVIEATDLNTAIDSAIAALPELRRRAITLRWSEGMPYPEIARIMEISLSHAYALVSRARDDIRDALKSWYP